MSYRDKKYNTMIVRIVDKVEEILYRRSITIEEIFKQYDPGLVYQPSGGTIEPQQD
jgi:hypothetical protein